MTLTPPAAADPTLVLSREPHPALAAFHPPVQAWFAASFESPTRVQELAWPLIARGESSLILAPTGSGKTLAAFLAAIDRLMFDPEPPKGEACRVLYISPLKALAVDVERNLRAPLVGAARYAERMGHPFRVPEVAIRTGDTPSRERARFVREPSDILITTPESLFLLLTSGAREALRSVRWVIVDEIHAMVGTKRGAHLALSLERLEVLTGAPLQRIGLSATVRPVEEAARFLGGFLESDEEALSLPHSPTQTDREPGPPTPNSAPRTVAIADARAGKRLDLRVEVPVEDMAKLGQVVEIPSGPASVGETRASIWPAIHPLVLDLVRAHRSTLIFVNSRRLAERMATALNELAGEEIVRAHHGSIAREQRLQIEDDLKAGRLPALVATSSLELGIDMGAIDLVVQVEAPPSVASGIQRTGRAGHQIGVPSKSVLIPKYRGDLLACAALTERMEAGAVEPVRYPRNPLDVLAQQVVGMVAMEEWKVDDLERLVRRAAPFSELSRSMLEGVLDMLSGRYPSDDFAELRPRLTWDRLEGTLHARDGARRVAVSNSGTIPDRGLYGVYLAGAESDRGRPSPRVGELDEEMVFETRAGETFLLGASTWRVEEITRDRVLVSPAPGVPGKMPFWKGDSPGRPLEAGRAIGALTRALRERMKDETGRAEALRLLVEKHSLAPGAARNLLRYLEDQEAASGAVPDDRTLVVERYQDEMGDWRVCILSPFGSRVHAPWAMAIEARLRAETDLEVELMWTDDGIIVRFPETDEPPPAEAVIPDPDEVEDLVVRQLAKSALFAGRFREAAARALLLPRKFPGRRAPLWQQRRRAADLLAAASQYGSFPIILEAFRECLRDVFDMPALIELLRDLRRRTIRTVTVTTRTPSPFAATLLYNYVANFIYEGDTPLAERRAQALSVDQSQLRELLGEVELRDLLDPEALANLELQLQHLTEERKARTPDALHDLLLRLGDLSTEEIRARVQSPEPAVQSPKSKVQSPEAMVQSPKSKVQSPESGGFSPTLDAGNSGSADEQEGDGLGGPDFGLWTLDFGLSELERSRRIAPLKIAGERRYIAAEDAGRYRDALGIPPPPGLPDAFLEAVRDPLGDLVARYARTHGPFQAADVAVRFGIGQGPVLAVLHALEASGRVVQGAFRPGGAGVEWCDAAVLRMLRQKSLARLRHEVEPVEGPALGRLYLAWQGIGGRRSGPDALLETIEQLQGAPLPASDLESRILPARLDDYHPHDLDALTASGAVIWVGHEPLGERDGRVGLYLVEHAGLLLPARGERLDGPLHDRIREHLAARGASFFPQLLQACGGGFFQEVLDALWDLVWAGEVTNDTLQPLRSFLDPRRRSGARTAYRPLGLRTRALLPPETAGRWSLVSSFLFGAPTPTERLAARARQLLDRYGVLAREAVHSEGIEGGYSAVYPVLRGMEEAGQIRRGYFVAGRGATQFALPGAVDRLRALREPAEEPHSVLLAATDPANPYGAALPWPESGRSEGATERRRDGETQGLSSPTPPLSHSPTPPFSPSEEAGRPGRRAARAAGAVVVLVDGALAAWMGRMERGLLTFFDQVPDRDPEEIAAEVARVLAEQVRPGGRRALFIREVDGRPAQETLLGYALREAGFSFGVHGFMKRL